LNISNIVANDYLTRLDDQLFVRRGLLACSASLQLDDSLALDLIELATGANGCAPAVLRAVKQLGCVREQWDGTWYVAEDVRSHLSGCLDQEFPQEMRYAIRDVIAERAEQQAARLSKDGQITTYRKRIAQFEVAYQRCLIPDKAEDGARQFEGMWEDTQGSGKTATCRAIDHIAPEIERSLDSLPPQIRFFQGMAAYQRGEKARAILAFRELWDSGNAGKIYGIAAHLYGRLEQNREVAERAFSDSILRYEHPDHRGQVYHSLGNLLSRDRKRWAEAEAAYRDALEILQQEADMAQVYHSLGNLLSRDQKRWAEAESAFRASLKLDNSNQGHAQVYHSLGNLLSRDQKRWVDAEAAFRESLDLNRDGYHQAQVYHSLGNLHSRNQKRWAEAETAFRESLKREDSNEGRALVYHSLGNLLSRDQKRWVEAEAAFRKSIELDCDRYHQAQVYHSLGNLFSRNRERWIGAETAYRDSLEILQQETDKAQVYHSLGNLLSRDPKRWAEAEAAFHESIELDRDRYHQAQVYHSLANLLSRNQRRWAQAEAAFRESLDLNRDGYHQAQVYASWGLAIVRGNRRENLADALIYGERVLELRSDSKAKAIAHKLLVDVYEAMGNWTKAIEALEILIDINKSANVDRYHSQNLARLARLREKLTQHRRE
jgi:tetratricopeptide (TPR) repeat protein